MAPRPASNSADALLVQAHAARTPSGRAKYATRGLSQQHLARDTQFLLLRQLMIARLENRQFAAARVIAEQMTKLGYLEDVAHFDASNLAVVCGDWPSALAHARLAARAAPASRRGALHLTLGRRLAHAERYGEAARAFERAQRWAPRLRPICEAQIALFPGHDAEECSAHAQHEAAYAGLQSLGDPGPNELWLAVRLLLRLQRHDLLPELLHSLQQQLQALSPAARIGYWAEERELRDLLQRLTPVGLRDGALEANASETRDDRSGY